MKFTKEYILTEIPEALGFIRDENDRNIYHDGIGSMEDKTIEELIELYAADVDDSGEEEKMAALCMAAKRYFKKKGE